MDVVSFLIWWGPVIFVCAAVTLCWLDMLRPAPRRKLLADRLWVSVLLLFSAWEVLVLVSRLAGPPPGPERVLVYARRVLAAAALVPGLLLLRPRSRAFRRGLRFSKWGDQDRAAQAYRGVLGSGRRREIPQAAYCLGCALMRQGDLDGAGIAFQHAIDSGQRHVVAAAAFNLGYLLEHQGDTEGARIAYQRVIGVRGTRHAARAAWRLGCVLQRQGDTEGARAAYRRAIDDGPRDVREAAARSLIDLNHSQADE